ncbi:hypothetical protein CPC08DRAFT_616066, partial [Agrocybe pediades]
IPLHLPSALPPTADCDTRLREIEYQLRIGQCNDSLDDLRNQLCVRAYVMIDKKRFQRGQKANTRSNAAIDKIHEKVNSAASRYRTARKAVSFLASQLQ